MRRTELPFRGTSEAVTVWAVASLQASKVAGKCMLPLQMSKMARFWNFLECSWRLWVSFQDWHCLSVLTSTFVSPDIGCHPPAASHCCATLHSNATLWPADWVLRLSFQILKFRISKPVTRRAFPFNVAPQHDQQQNCSMESQLDWDLGFRV